MFYDLTSITTQPPLYSTVTTPELWTDDHISARMLAAHLNPDVDLSSYRVSYIEEVVGWLSSHFSLSIGKRVADFGCGPGLYTSRIARTGATVMGIDLSSRSLGYARRFAAEERLQISYIQADYLTFKEAVRFDLIVMVMRDYCALTPTARQELLGSVIQHLAPGGSFVFDADHTPGFASRHPQSVFGQDLMDGFWSANPYFGFLNTYRYEQQRVALDRYEIIEEKHTRTFCNWTRYFTPGELVSELKAGGFCQIDIMGDLAGNPFDRDSPVFGVVASI